MGVEPTEPNCQQTDEKGLSWELKTGGQAGERAWWSLPLPAVSASWRLKTPDREDSYQPRLLRQGPPSGDPVLNTAGKQGGQSLTRSCRNPLPWDLDKEQCFGCRGQALVAPPHFHVAPTSAAIWKALLRLASRLGPSVLPSLLRKVLGRLGPRIRTHALSGSGPEPPWGPLAKGTLPSLASTDPR